MNTNSIKKSINLKNSLNLSKNNKVSNFATFTSNNSAYFNQALSPFYYKKTKNETEPVFDQSGKKYSLNSGTFYIDDQPFATVTSKGFNRETLNPKSDCFTVDGDDLISIVKEDKVVSAYKNDQLLNTWIFETGETLTDRVVKTEAGNYFYFNLSSSGTFHVWEVKTDNYWSFDNIFQKDVTSPKIFFNYERYKTPIACVVNKTGSQIKANEFEAITFLQTSTGWFKATLSQNTGTVISTGTYQGSIKCSVTESKSLENKTCYYIDGKYYTDETKTEEVTFSIGYSPKLVESNIYNYTVYTTVYKISTTGNNFTKNGKTTYEFSILNPTYSTDKNNYTIEITDLDETEQVYELTFVNNNGYILDRGFSTPTVTFEIGSGELFYSKDISLKYIGFDTSYKKQNAQWVTLSIPYKIITTGATSTYTKYCFIDDGFFYGYSDTYGTWNNTLNTNLVNTVTAITGNIMTITPAYKVWTGVLIDNGMLTQPYSLEVNQYCFKFSTVFMSTSTEGRSLIFDSTCWNKTSHGCWLGAGVNVYTDTIDLSDGETVTDNYRYVTSNLQGSRYSEKDFKVLYNDGYISGVSFSEDKNEMGTLLSTWSSLDTDFYLDFSDDYIIYKQNDSFYRISLKEQNDLRIFEKRYIVLNTCDYYNCYDNKLKKMTHYATDWNNRTLGWVAENKTADLVTYATGENINFSQSDSTLVSTIWPYHAYAFSGKLDYNHVYSNKGSVELYFADGATVPEYVNTNLNYFNSHYVINDQVLNYPSYSTSQLFINPDFFAEFVNTYVNQDFVKNGDYAYNLTYFNTNIPILLANTSSYVSNMSELFVIQSMAYGIFDHKIYTLTFNNSSYTASEAIIDVTGMTFIGATPVVAYFYSKTNKSIYGFTGDCNLQLIEECSKISEVYKTFYNTATQTIYLATDTGLIMIGQNTYKLDFFNIKNIFFTDSGFVFIIDGDDTWQISSDYVEEFETNKVRLDTGLYGNSDNKIVTVDRWKIRLYNQQHLNGTVKLKSYTLTDTGKIEEEDNVIEISKKDWDNMFDTTLISYTPKYNRGVGVGLKLESDFSVSDLIASVIIDNNTQRGNLNA